MPDPPPFPSPTSRPSRETFQEIPNPYHGGPRLPRAGERLPSGNLPPHPATPEAASEPEPAQPPGYVMPGARRASSPGAGTRRHSSAITTPVILWAIFWGLWIIPGCFPLMGLPGGLILVLLAPNGKWDLQATIGLTFMMAVWGWISLGITVLWRFASLELLRRTEILSFSVVYAIVFLIPVLILGMLSLFSVLT